MITTRHPLNCTHSFGGGGRQAGSNRSHTKRRVLLPIILAILTVTAISLLPSDQQAYAQTIVAVPADWDYTPNGLADGDTFRLLFSPSEGHSFTDTKIQDLIESSNIFTYGKATYYHITDDPDVECYGYYGQTVGSDVYWDIVKRNNNGEGTDINGDSSDYCYYVYKRTVSVANSEPSAMREFSEYFRVLHFGHSDRDSVRSNTYTQEGVDVPIYWLGSNSKIADNYNDFYAGDTPGESSESRNEHGKYTQAARYSYGISPIFRVTTEDVPAYVIPTVTLSPSRALEQTEGGNTRTYIHLSNPSLVDITVRAFVVELGDVLIPVYRPVGPNVIFENPINAGDVQANRMILVTDDDNVHEPDGTITYTLLPGDGYIVGEPSTVTFTIRDNDPDPNPPPPPPPPPPCTTDKPCVTLDTSGSYFEGRKVSIPIHVDPPHISGTALPVMFETRDSGHILEASNNMMHIFGVHGRVDYFQSETVRDCNPSGQNWIEFRLKPSKDYQIRDGDENWQRMTLIEHKPHPDGPVFWLDKSVIPDTVTEGDTVNLAGLVKSEYLACSDIYPRVSLSITGAVSSDNSFSSSFNNDVLIAQGKNQNPGGGIVTKSNGNDNNPAGTIKITLHSRAGYQVGSANTVTISVADSPHVNNSPPPPPEVSIGISGGGSEGDHVSFGINASPAPLSPLPVNVTLSGAGGILNASDAGWRIVEIPPIGSYTLEVPTIDDGVIDVNNVTLTINPGAGYTLGQFASWTVDVQDTGTTSSLMQPPPVYNKLAQAQNLTAVAIDPALVANVTVMANQTQHGDAHVERWSRVLAAFGYITHDNPTTAAEARDNAKKYSSPLWPLIADVLTLLEAAAEQDGPQTPPDVPTEPDAPPAIDPELVSKVRAQAAQTQHGDAHVDRWNRVLAAFGEITHDNPMTAAEARTNAEKYSSPLWPQIADALAARE